MTAIHQRRQPSCSTVVCDGQSSVVCQPPPSQGQGSKPPPQKPPPEGPPPGGSSSGGPSHGDQGSGGGNISSICENYRAAGQPVPAGTGLLDLAGQLLASACNIPGHATSKILDGSKPPPVTPVPPAALPVATPTSVPSSEGGDSAAESSSTHSLSFTRTPATPDPSAVAAAAPSTGLDDLVPVPVVPQGGLGSMVTTTLTLSGSTITTFLIGPGLPTTTMTLSPTGGPASALHDSGGISKGALAAVITGTTLFFLLLVLAGFLFCRRRQRRKDAENIKYAARPFEFGNGTCTAPEGSVFAAQAKEHGHEEALPPYLAPSRMSSVGARPLSEKEEKLDGDAKLPAYGYTLHEPQVEDGYGYEGSYGFGGGEHRSVGCADDGMLERRGRARGERDGEMVQSGLPVVLAPLRRHD